MEQVVSQDQATNAWRAVKRNGGAPGIDRMTTEQLRDHVRSTGRPFAPSSWPGVCAQPGAASGNPQAQRRNPPVGDTDGARPMDPANAVAGAATHLRSHLQPPQLRVPTGPECPRRGARSANLRPQGQGLGGGHGHHEVLQPPDAANRTSGGVGGRRGAIPGNRPDPDEGRRCGPFIVAV